MPKNSAQPGGKKASSKKLDAAIIVALIALVGTLVTALLNSSVIIEWLKQKPPATEPSASPAISVASPASSNPTLPNPVVSPVNIAGCLAEYFADVAPDKLISMEVGVTAQDHQFSGQELEGQELVGPFGVKLTQNGQPIAAFQFLFFVNSELFKLTSVVNANCEAVADYSNARGGDRNAIENSGWLNLRLAEGVFQLNFQRMGLNKIRFKFQQIQ